MADEKISPLSLCGPRAARVHEYDTFRLRSTTKFRHPFVARKPVVVHVQLQRRINAIFTTLGVLNVFRHLSLESIRAELSVKWRLEHRCDDTFHFILLPWFKAPRGLLASVYATSMIHKRASHINPRFRHHSPRRCRTQPAQAHRQPHSSPPPFSPFWAFSSSLGPSPPSCPSS